MIFTGENQTEGISSSSEVAWVILNQLVFLIPVLDFFFFRKLVSGMEDISGVRVKYCRGFFGLKSQHSDDKPLLD